jgi:chromosome segregation ATPase
LQLQHELKEQIRTSQANFSMLKVSQAVNSDLQNQLDVCKTEVEQSYSVQNDSKERLESIEEDLRIKNMEQTQLLTKILELQTEVESLNQTIQSLYKYAEDVSTCKVEGVTVRSLKYLTQSDTSNLGQTATFRLNVLLP